MAEDIKISALTPMTDAATDDYLVIADSTNNLETKRVTVVDLMDPLVVGKNLSMRPAFVAGRTGGVSKPTMVAVGAYGTYSFPIFNNDDEELFWRLQVPGRWDGASNITYSLVCALSAAEDENDDFQFQLSWARVTPGSGAISSSTTDVSTPVNISTGQNAQYYSFRLDFTINYTTPNPDLLAGDVLAGRIRRIASGGTEVSNEILVLDHWLTFTVNKIFKDPPLT